jgi:arylsulfatase
MIKTLLTIPLATLVLLAPFARPGNAMGGVPLDRVIDGIDRSGVLLLGDTHGGRDYVHIYEGAVLKSVVKKKYKMHLAPPGENPIISVFFYDLYRDPRESRPVDSIEYCPWAGGQFAGMIKRHMELKKKYSNRPAIEVEYSRISNSSAKVPRTNDVDLMQAEIDTDDS